MRAAIKWIASSLNLDSENFSLRSLRSGGASTLFPNGIELEIIRRFGRWGPSQFHIYLYGDSLDFRKLSLSLCHESNLTIQIKMPNDLRAEDNVTNQPNRDRNGRFQHRLGSNHSSEIPVIVEAKGLKFTQEEEDSENRSSKDDRSVSSQSQIAEKVFSASGDSEGNGEVDVHGASSCQTVACVSFAPCLNANDVSSDREGPLEMRCRPPGSGSEEEIVTHRDLPVLPDQLTIEANIREGGVCSERNSYRFASTVWSDESSEDGKEEVVKEKTKAQDSEDHVPTQENGKICKKRIAKDVKLLDSHSWKTRS